MLECGDGSFDDDLLECGDGSFGDDLLDWGDGKLDDFLVGGDELDGVLEAGEATSSIMDR